ncbi:MAG TPA: AraC family transcriptional regulator [Acidobacteriaceae bacterium]
MFLNEAIVWQPTQDGGQRLYGNLDKLGVSIEWHDFELSADAAFKWSQSFHPNSLELCLNLEGHGSIHCADSVMSLEPLTAGIYAPGKNELRSWRKPGERHRFITVKFSRRFLREQLMQYGGALEPLVDKFLLDGDNGVSAGLGEVQQLSTEQERLIAQLVHQEAFQGARQLRYQGVVLQLMADFFFEPCDEEELLFDRKTQLARERVGRVADILQRNLTEPPKLGEIGREVGCSPFYLSRTFSREMGMTIPQYLRKLRMQRAAELLKSGRCNVTEAAMEVGYSSLSHFSQAFCQTMGCCPALYPLKESTPAATACRNLRPGGEGKPIFPIFQESRYNPSEDSDLGADSDLDIVDAEACRCPNQDFGGKTSEAELIPS